MRRLQFPLRVALAIMINKAQGQSRDCVAVDRSMHAISTHGQLMWHCLEPCVLIKLEYFSLLGTPMI
ncbi:BQ2448_7869 [Microbotryum intermedium]|uniref:BQ2448_7861 protein n=1 Tax=Microbotryum intermedium TaxID=269621 RepID=A0A238FM50_9BASI|nr:BQ2448_7861 [Microbotryum intermedium]SCV74840.1 BQ2448_7869 [Microbotryum intermedium]